MPADAITRVFSIAEFCKLHRISTPHFFNLQKRGQAPEVLKVGRRVLITAEAVRNWRDTHTIKSEPK